MKIHGYESVLLKEKEEAEKKKEGKRLEELERKKLPSVPFEELRMRKVLPGRNFSFSFNFPPHGNYNSSQIVVFTAAENSQIVYIFYYTRIPIYDNGIFPSTCGKCVAGELQIV